MAGPELFVLTEFDCIIIIIYYINLEFPECGGNHIGAINIILKKRLKLY